MFISEGQLKVITLPNNTKQIKDMRRKDEWRRMV